MTEAPCSQSAHDKPEVLGRVPSLGVSPDSSRVTSRACRGSRPPSASGQMGVEILQEEQSSTPSSRLAHDAPGCSSPPTCRLPGTPSTAAPSAGHRGANTGKLSRLGAVMWTLFQQPGLTLTLLLVLMPSERLSSELQLSTLLAILFLTVTVHFGVPGVLALLKALQRRATVASMRLDFRLRLNKNLELSVAPWAAAYHHFARSSTAQRVTQYLVTASHLGSLLLVCWQGHVEGRPCSDAQMQLVPSTALLLLQTTASGHLRSDLTSKLSFLLVSFGWAAAVANARCFDSCALDLSQLDLQPASVSMYVASKIMLQGLCFPFSLKHLPAILLVQVSGSFATSYYLLSHSDNFRPITESSLGTVPWDIGLITALMVLVSSLTVAGVRYLAEYARIRLFVEEQLLIRQRKSKVNSIWYKLLRSCVL